MRKGRREEFAALAWEGGCPTRRTRQPFSRSKLDLTVRREGEQALIHEFYRQLLALRKEHPRPAAIFDREHMEVIGFDEQKVLVVRRQARQSSACSACSVSATRGRR